MSKHVVIAGGGIAGMSAAHYLAEAGFHVTLCEAAPELGGKAKSLRTPDGNPTEHSLRVYSSDYLTLLPLLARIPDGEGRSVLDNLMQINPVRAVNDGFIGRPTAPRPVRRMRGGKFEIALRNLWSVVRAIPRAVLLTIGSGAKEFQPGRLCERYISTPVCCGFARCGASMNWALFLTTTTCTCLSARLLFGIISQCCLAPSLLRSPTQKLLRSE